MISDLSFSVSSLSVSPVNFPVIASRLYLGGMVGPNFPCSAPSSNFTPNGSSTLPSWSLSSPPPPPPVVLLLKNRAGDDEARSCDANLGTVNCDAAILPWYTPRENKTRRAAIIMVDACWFCSYSACVVDFFVCACRLHGGGCRKEFGILKIRHFSRICCLHVRSLRSLLARVETIINDGVCKSTSSNKVSR